VEEALGAVKQLVEGADLARSARHDEARTLPEIVVVDLGDRRPEPVLQLRLRRGDVLALSFKRAGLGKVQLYRENSDVAGRNSS
jgi:hypothetical protein